MLVKAERVVERRFTEQEVALSNCRSAAMLHGYTEGDDCDIETAKRVYLKGREARQQVHASARAAHAKVQRLQDVLSSQIKALPPHIQREFPPHRIEDIAKTLRHLMRWTSPAENVLERQRPKSDLELSLSSQTLLWWRIYMPAYAEKWDHMCRLAKVWHLYKSQDLDSFKRYMRKISAGRTRILACPPYTGM